MIGREQDRERSEAGRVPFKNEKALLAVLASNRSECCPKPAGRGSTEVEQTKSVADVSANARNVDCLGPHHRQQSELNESAGFQRCTYHVINEDAAIIGARVDVPLARPAQKRGAQCDSNA